MQRRRPLRDRSMIMPAPTSSSSAPASPAPLSPNAFRARSNQFSVLNRHEPRGRATAASTALLQSEIDAPRLSSSSAWALRRPPRSIAGACARSASRRPRPAVRLPLPLRGAALGSICRQRARSFGPARGAPASISAGIEGRLLDAASLKAESGLDRDGALLYGGSAEAHPIDLANGLMQVAIGRGARVASPVEVVAYESSACEGITLATRDGTRSARQNSDPRQRLRDAGLRAGPRANGLRLDLGAGHGEPRSRCRDLAGSERFSGRRAEPYLYPRGRHGPAASSSAARMRTPHGRNEKRDALTPEKIATLRKKLSRAHPRRRASKSRQPGRAASARPTTGCR